MTNLPAQRKRTAPENLPTPMVKFSPPWLKTLLAACGNDHHPTIPARLAPTENQRGEIKDRVGFLIKLIRAETNRELVAVELARLLTAFPARSGEAETSVKLRMAAYFGALEQLPLWAIRQAVNAVIRGEADVDMRFSPTPPQLADLARKFAKPVRGEFQALTAVLRAEIEFDPSDDERGRVAAGMMDLVSELRATETGEDEDLAAKRKAALERANQRAFERDCEAHGVDPKGGVSPALLESLDMPAEGT